MTTEIYFFSVIGRPPISTLFPYTTLFRSVETTANPWANAGGESKATMPSAGRSEEHTSELQSLRHLVCRLLLCTNDHRDLLFFRDRAPTDIYPLSLHDALPICRDHGESLGQRGRGVKGHHAKRR